MHACTQTEYYTRLRKLIRFHNSEKANAAEENRSLRPIIGKVSALLTMAMLHFITAEVKTGKLRTKKKHQKGNRFSSAVRPH